MVEWEMKMVELLSCFNISSNLMKCFTWMCIFDIKKDQVSHRRPGWDGFETNESTSTGVNDRKWLNYFHIWIYLKQSNEMHLINMYTYLWYSEETTSESQWTRVNELEWICFRSRTEHYLTMTQFILLSRIKHKRRSKCPFAVTGHQIANGLYSLSPFFYGW